MTNSSPEIQSAMTPDQSAAHCFLSELRTRISTQPLPYQYGVEASALESLWKVFDYAREAMKKNPGCQEFAAAVTEMLNIDLRPVTAKWHKALIEGRLSSRDGADSFRGDLARVQQRLRDFTQDMHRMAYNKDYADRLSPPALSDKEIEDCFEPVPFGISKGLNLLGPRVQNHGQVSDKTIDNINEDERKEVNARREGLHTTLKPPKDMNAVGLSLSGGGIRSATFCLGVIQVLAARGFLKQVDFLSTVSGGGYTGSFITSHLGDGAAEAEFGGPHGPDTKTIQYLRQRAKYLSALNLKQAWRNVTSTLAGMLLNWTAPLLVVVVAALLAHTLPRFIFADSSALGEPFWFRALTVSVGLSGLGIIAYCSLMRAGKRLSTLGTAILAFLFAATVAIAALWLLLKGHQLHSATIISDWKLPVTLSALIAAGPTVIRFIPVLHNPRRRKLILKSLLFIAGLLIPVMTVLLIYTFYDVGSIKVDSSASLWNLRHYTNGVGILSAAALLLLLIAALLNVNLTAPHHLYRNSLARTFVLKSDNQDINLPLIEINKSHSAPYHLLNAALNLPSSTHPALRDRKCDFFVFAKCWSGSVASNFYPTKDWKMNGSPADLATAMAISGAAASSHMGLGSMPALTALLTFLNIRLGFWIRRPDNPGLGAPGFLCLLREMIGSFMSEKQIWLNLSDGGHIENLGLYELLRRRCKFIISVDGEADPLFTFQGLMTATRHAQIDFGIRIESNLDELRADPKSGWTQTHARLCRVHYPPAPSADGRPAAIGLLLYIKSSVTGNESELIKRYRINNPDFPHQSTLDQFFDQEQFEAYRQLGAHVAEGLYSSSLMSKQPPNTIPDWFRRLAQNLLEPETL